jgi:EmrB/QacA subfamily drug resistance transporter
VPIATLRRLDQRTAVAAVFVAAMFMVIMDTTIVNVTLPTLSRQFHVSADGVDAVSIGYLVSYAVFIPISGWAGDRLGGRRTLLGAISIFVAASALCGLSTGFEELVAFRIMQGVGGGLMTPVGMTMLFRVFPPRERVRVSSILMIPTGLAPTLGPVLGGIFTTELTWRWVFYVNVPIGLAAVAFGMLALSDHVQPGTKPLDVCGFLLSGAGLGLAMYGVSEGPLEGWSGVDVMATASAGAALLCGFFLYERARRHPLIDLSLFGDRLFRSTMSVSALGSVAFLGTVYLAALYFQSALGMSALHAGLTIFPEALGVMFGSQIVSRLLYPRLGPRRLLVGGLLAIALPVLLLTQVGPSTSEWLIRIDMFMLGYGMGHVILPAQAASFTTISPARTSGASVILEATLQLGAALGVALVTAVIAQGPARHLGTTSVPTISAYRYGFVAAAIVAVAGAAVAFTVSDADAAPTMVPKMRVWKGASARRPKESRAQARIPD